MARRIMVLALMIAGVVCAGLLWHAGPAYAGKVKFDMPQEMTGFVGTLVAKAYDVNVPGDKWSPAGWVAKGNKVSVTLKKITEEKTVTLALEKAPGDKMVPRADLLKVLDDLTPGAVIIVELDRDTLKGIKPYEPPKKGQFVKTTSQKAGDKFLPAVQIKDDAGADQTLVLNPKNATELSREAHNLKAGAAILYRTDSDDKGTWLTAIWPEP